MRRFRFWPRMALVFAVGLMSGGCILIPEIEDRVVELALTGSTVVEIHSSGTVNNHDETKTVDVLESFDLAQILADAGIDVSDVQQVALSGLEYRVTVADPNAGREIVDGTVTIDRNGSGPLTLLSAFNAAAGAATGWQEAPLDPSGEAVAEINAMLNDIRTALPGKPPANLTTLTYHVTGQSLPALVPTDFTWELKVKISITGTVNVRVPA